MSYASMERGQVCAEPIHVGRWDGSSLGLQSAAGDPTVPGVVLSKLPTFVDDRRVLVVSYNSSEPPGTLGYTVIVRPGHAVGDHYHFKRSERIVVLQGNAEFRLCDQREGETIGLTNRFMIHESGRCVSIPVGVAHAIINRGYSDLIIEVLANADYDREDDVHLSLSTASEH